MLRFTTETSMNSFSALFTEDQCAMQEAARAFARNRLMALSVN